MNWTLLIAIVSALLGSGGVVGVVTLAVKGAYRFGEHAADLRRVKTDLERVGSAQTAADRAAGDTSGRLSALEATVEALGNTVHSGFERLERAVEALPSLLASGRRRGAQGES